MAFFKKQFDRALQSVEETIGTSQKTEYDPKFLSQLNKTENFKSETEKLLISIQCYLQPDITARIVPDALNKAIPDSFISEGLNRAEQVGEEMGAFGAKLGGDASPYGKALKAGSDAFAKVGTAEKDFLNLATQVYIQPVKKFLQEDFKKFDTERKTLENRRVDMDVAKNKVAKEKESDKKLKEKEKSTEQPKATEESIIELDRKKTSFDQQQSKVEEIMTDLEAKIPSQQKLLQELIKARVDHLNKCAGLLNDYHENMQ